MSERRKNKPIITVVIPLYNEEDVVSKLFDALNNLHPNEYSLSFVFVDDGSRDNTLKMLKKVKLLHKKTIISFSRNFGHQSALLAGLNHAKGDFIVTMDSDLQHPPQLIETFYSLHKQGFDIIFTKRNSEQKVSLKYLTSKLFYKLINSFSSTNIPESGSDFRSMSRPALNSLLSMNENRKFLRGMASWIGYKTTVISYDVKERSAGKSKFTVGKMASLSLSAITSFSTSPLYFALTASFVFFTLSILYAVYVLYIRFVLQLPVDGWASVIFILLLLSAFICFYLSLLGVYIAAIVDEVKNRPQYIIKEKYEVH